MARLGEPFVFGTGYARLDVLGSFADRPVLHKPYRSSDLSEAIRRVVA